MQRRFIRAMAALLLASASLSAHAFDAAAHRLIGAIADRLLDAAVAQRVHAELGYSLQTAAPWADCVRNVRRDGDRFRYTIDADHPEYQTPCTAFDAMSERKRIEDYARRNWKDCNGAGNNPCHSRYHYTDIAIQHTRYQRRWLGSRDDDVVAAISAATAVLRGLPCPRPFSIADKKEALLMLAHFVGDLHQPLHVGSVYLDAHAQPFDPDARGHAIDADTDTHGGNALRDPLSGRNLHAIWDRKPERLGDTVNHELLAQAQRVAVSKGPIESWPAAWASDSLQAARRAFDGLTYQRDRDRAGQWQIQFADRARYERARLQAQQRAIVRAGARLAQLLNAIDASPPTMQAQTIDPRQ